MAEDTTTRPAEEDMEPLTEWANEPTLKELKQNLDNADIDNETHHSNVQRWLDYRNMEGEAKPKTMKGRSSIAPKTIRKANEWRYAALASPFLSTPDMYNVSPKSAGDRSRAQQNALVINHQFDTTIDKVKFVGSYVRDAVDTGTVIVEVNWVTEEEEISEEVPVYEYEPTTDPAVAQKYLQLMQIRQHSEDAYQNNMNPGLDRAVTLFAQTQGNQLVVEIDTGETETKTETIETANYPSVEVCTASNILVDPSCEGDLKKAEFIGKRHKSSLSELRKDGRYKNLKYIVTESADTITDPDFQDSKDISSFTFKDEPRKQFVVHTYWGTWDIHDTGIVVPIVASWVNDTLIQMEENYFPFKRPPFAIANYMPVRDSVFGEPDAELLIDNQKVIGAVTRGSVDLMGRAANSQTGTKRGFLDAANQRRFKRGEDYEFQAQGKPDDSVYQHKYPEIPASVFNMLGMQNNEVESMSGIKAFASTGINGDALGNSVGGGRDALDAASKRESDILMRLAAGILDIGYMIIAMNSEWLSEEEVIRITDEEFVTVRRDDLAGKFDLKLDISTAEEDNRKAQESAFMMQTVGNNMDQGLRNIILSDIARLRNMPVLAKRIEEYKPEPDPLVVMEQQLKVRLLEAQIAKENMLAYKHKTEAEANGARGYKDKTQGDLNTSKAGTETKKGRNLDEDSDLKSLEYLDQFSGQAHEKQKDLQNNQADKAIEAEAVKSQLTPREGE